MGWPSDVASDLLIGLVSGVVAILIVEAGRWVNQWWIDTHSKQPFTAVVVGWGPRASPQLRVLVHNLRSSATRLVAEPIDRNRKPVNGWRAIEPWGHNEISNGVLVGAGEWREFWIEFNGDQRPEWPSHVYFLASYITFMAGVPRTIPIEFDDTTAAQPGEIS
jgi:hypothetical protein